MVVRGTTKVQFVFEAETKGAFRFSEVNGNGEKVTMESATIGTIYLRKSAIGTKLPDESLSVTLQFGK